MRISYLIKELEQLKEKNGDLIVYISADGFHYGVAEDIAVDSDDDVIISGSGRVLLQKQIEED